MSNLKILTDKQLAPLLSESEHAFLPAKSHPNETASSLIQKFKKDKRYDTFGYIVDNKAISYIIALSGRRDEEIAIGPMYVAEDFRGNGYGKQQIADFIQLFTDREYELIYTKTWSRNTASRHSFESLGFAEIDCEDGDRADGDSTISYALPISKS